MSMLGHNDPPQQTAIERGYELLVSVNKALRELKDGIANGQQAGLLQELLTQVRQCIAQLEREMKAERAPLDIQVASIRTKYRDIELLLSRSLELVRELLTPWLKKVEQRLEQEQDLRRREAEAAQRDAEHAADAAMTDKSVEAQVAAERAAQVAADAADAAERPVERARVKGDLAPRASSLVTTWHAEIGDEDKALQHFITDPEVRTAALDKIRQVASRLARKLKDEQRAPPGIRFVREETAR